MSVAWSPERIARYAQHVLLPDVGGRGQDRLRAAVVAVSIGGPAARVAAVYLAAGGIGTVLVVGDDRVVDDRLARFPIGRDAIGGSLLAALAAALVARNPEVVVTGAVEVATTTLTIADDPEAASLGAAFARGGEAAARLLHAIATGAA